MQGLVNFAAQCALIFAVLLPTFLYLSALGLFIFAVWGMWMQAQPRNPFAGKPWIPWVSLVLSGAFASFPTILNMVNISAGSSVTTSVVAGLSSYTTPDTTNILGNTPGDTVLNIVTAFQGFFQVVRSDVRVLRHARLARSRCRPDQPAAEQLRHPVRLRRNADERADHHSMAGWCFHYVAPKNCDRSRRISPPSAQRDGPSQGVPS